MPGAASPAGLLEAARALDGIPHLADQTGLIVHRLGRLAELPGWPAAQQALRAPRTPDDVPPLLRQLVHATTVRYLGSGYGSPVLLVHTATAPNAVLRALPHLPRDQWAPSLAAVWSAIAAIIAAYEPSRLRPRGDWPRPAAGDGPYAAVERAAAHGDEHVVKFTDTAVEVFHDTGDPDTLAAAAHIAELITPPGSPLPQSACGRRLPVKSPSFDFLSTERWRYLPCSIMQHLGGFLLRRARRASPGLTCTPQAVTASPAAFAMLTAVCRPSSVVH